MFERDKNHPSILLWSLGNESGALWPRCGVVLLMRSDATAVSRDRWPRFGVLCSDASEVATGLLGCGHALRPALPPYKALLALPCHPTCLTCIWAVRTAPSPRPLLHQRNYSHLIIVPAGYGAAHLAMAGYLRHRDGSRPVRGTTQGCWFSGPATVLARARLYGHSRPQHVAPPSTCTPPPPAPLQPLNSLCFPSPPDTL